MTITRMVDLSDVELTATLGRLAQDEREATAALIVHLAEFDARRLYEGAGFSSLFKYCMAVLHLSEDAVYNRIQTARAARRYPVMIDMLVSGALGPTTARLLARRLTDENHEDLLAEAQGKTKQEVEQILARRFPAPDVKASVRGVPNRSVTEATATEATATAARPQAAPFEIATGRPFFVTAAPGVEAPGPVATPASTQASHSEVQSSLHVHPAGASRSMVRPLSDKRYEVRFTASAETRERLRRAQDLLGHAVPSGDLAEVFDRALVLLVKDLERKKFAATERPRPSPPPSGASRHIPASVRREVTAQDQGRCGFVAQAGRRCDERRFLEFHHVIPYGVGGLATIENIELRCRAHNGYEADRFYGPGKRRATGGRTRSGTSHPVPARTAAPTPG
jgi:hypothetical protein